MRERRHRQHPEPLGDAVARDEGRDRLSPRPSLLIRTRSGRRLGRDEDLVQRNIPGIVEDAATDRGAARLAVANVHARQCEIAAAVQFHIL